MVYDSVIDRLWLSNLLAPAWPSFVQPGAVSRQIPIDKLSLKTLRLFRTQERASLVLKSQEGRQLQPQEMAEEQTLPPLFLQALSEEPDVPPRPLVSLFFFSFWELSGTGYRVECSFPSGCNFSGEKAALRALSSKYSWLSCSCWWWQSCDWWKRWCHFAATECFCYIWLCIIYTSCTYPMYTAWWDFNEMNTVNQYPLLQI